MHVFGSFEKGRKALVFLSNVQENKDVIFFLNGSKVVVPKWTVHIWGQQKGGSLKFLYSTLNVNVTYVATLKRQAPKTSDLILSIDSSIVLYLPGGFDIWDPSTAVLSDGPVEQLSLTKD